MNPENRNEVQPELVNDRSIEVIRIAQESQNQYRVGSPEASEPQMHGRPCDDRDPESRVSEPP